MSNVVEFKRPPKPPEPKKPIPPGLRKLAIGLAVIAAFVLAWAYFQYIGG